MPIGIKYSTVLPNNSLKKGNVAIGVEEVGPSSATDFYSMPTPVSGKYIVCKVPAVVGGIPNFYAPNDEAQMTTLARQEGALGSATSSLSQSLVYFGSQPNYLLANFQYEGIVTRGLAAICDGGFAGSYPTAATTWYDLSGNANNGTLTNGPTYNSANSGSIVFDGTNDYVAITNVNSLYLPNSMSIQMITKLDTLPPASSGNRMYLVCKGESNQFEWQSSINNFSTDFGKWCFLRYAATSPGGTLNGGSFRGRASATNATTNTWTNVAFVVTNSSSFNDVYINGVLDNGSTLSQNDMNVVQGTSDVRIGTRNLGEVYLDGNMGVVLIYNRNLSAAEVLQNHNALKGRFGI